MSQSDGDVGKNDTGSLILALAGAGKGWDWPTPCPCAAPGGVQLQKAPALQL